MTEYRSVQFSVEFYEFLCQKKELFEKFMMKKYSFEEFVKAVMFFYVDVPEEGKEWEGEEDSGTYIS